MDDSPDEHKSHFNRLGNLILIHINIAQDGSNSLQQYEAEWMNGTSLEISEKFDFDRPGCPSTKNGQPFEDFKCFDYLEDTIMTTTKKTTTTQPPPVTVRVPTQESVSRIIRKLLRTVISSVSSGTLESSLDKIFKFSKPFKACCHNFRSRWSYCPCSARNHSLQNKK